MQLIGVAEKQQPVHYLERIFYEMAFSYYDGRCLPGLTIPRGDHPDPDPEYVLACPAHLR
jgi:hypothetical protein